MATPPRTAAPSASGRHRRVAGGTTTGVADGVEAEVEADIASRANAMSLADWNRCDGLFSRQRWTTRSRCGGTAPAGSARRILLENRGHPLDRRLAAEGGTAREHLVEHRAEREDVGAVVGGFAAHLLRGHVPGRSQHEAGAGRWRGRQVRDGRVLAGRLDQPGQPEVEDLGAAVGRHEDVVGLQVAVDDALRVRGRQALRDLAGQVGRRSRRRAPPRSAPPPASRLRAAPARRRGRRRPRPRRTPPSRSGG